MLYNHYNSNKYIMVNLVDTLVLYSHHIPKPL
jgi:hypothetical protein